MSAVDDRSPVTEADLHAYVDDVLPQQRRAEIDAYLATRPTEAERLEAYRKQNEALRALFNPVLDEPVPARLTGAPRARQRHGRLAIAWPDAGTGAARVKR
jgi:anti-sigma factor RsiW